MFDTGRGFVIFALQKLEIRFENRELENLYQIERQERSRRIIPLVMLLSVILFAVFGLWDSTDSIRGSEQTRFRFFVAIPLLLIIFGATFTTLFKKGLENLFAWVFAFSSSTLAVAQILHYDNGPLALDSGTTALNFALICVAGIGLFPVNVVWSVTLGSTIIVIYVISILSFTTVDARVLAAYLFNIANIFSVLILMSYWRERFTREEFARNWLQEKERQKLSAFLSSYIPLTSLDDANNSSVAESFGEVTLLFSDIVGFTALTEHLAPRHVLEILDQVFSEFDLAADRHGIEKVKTIGDAYMAISGKKAATGNPAKAMIDFAIDAIKSVNTISNRVGFPLKIRVGVHTGSTIGGIVGIQKRTYDYWGRTVNLASRLELTGEPNRIHISEATYWRVREFFKTEDRGLTALKGMGSERSYFIVSN